ncbi:hypothetical protein [Flaviflagellibacter deserti]|uniref:Uncharacterized protein n=1 Tax=Flaviflagellibacter deserti TaxID=2267266 RepID=A0ABV9Z667_9HYPH
MEYEIKRPDILFRLRFYADDIEDVPESDLISILQEAAELIETLRDSVNGTERLARA